MWQGRYRCATRALCVCLERASCTVESFVALASCLCSFESDESSWVRSSRSPCSTRCAASSVGARPASRTMTSRSTWSSSQSGASSSALLVLITSPASCSRSSLPPRELELMVVHPQDHHHGLPCRGHRCPVPQPSVRSPPPSPPDLVPPEADLGLSPALADPTSSATSLATRATFASSTCALAARIRTTRPTSAARCAASLGPTTTRRR